MLHGSPVRGRTQSGTALMSGSSMLARYGASIKIYTCPHDFLLLMRDRRGAWEAPRSLVLCLERQAYTWSYASANCNWDVFECAGAQIRPGSALMRCSYFICCRELHVRCVCAPHHTKCASGRALDVTCFPSQPNAPDDDHGLCSHGHFIRSCIIATARSPTPGTVPMHL